MAEHTRDTRLTDVMESPTQSGLDGLADALRFLIDAAILFERERYLGASAYERTNERRNRKKRRTTNRCERFNRELRRPTRVESVLPNARSCERLVTAVPLEVSEDLETGMRYLSMPEEDRASGCVRTPVNSTGPKRGSRQSRRARHERVAARRAYPLDGCRNAG